MTTGRQEGDGAHIGSAEADGKRNSAAKAEEHEQQEVRNRKRGGSKKKKRATAGRTEGRRGSRQGALGDSGKYVEKN